MGHKPLRIAPRLANGDSRDRLYNALPPAVKTGLKLIARRDNISVSFLLERIIIRHFDLKRPTYVQRKRS